MSKVDLDLSMIEDAAPLPPAQPAEPRAGINATKLSSPSKTKLDSENLAGEQKQLGKEGVGAALIAAERARQMECEGWTTAHDAKHVNGEMALAAACYAVPEQHRKILPSEGYPLGWPPEWGAEWWKPAPISIVDQSGYEQPTAADRIRELSKAGALLAAEIDRLSLLRSDGPSTPRPVYDGDVSWRRIAGVGAAPEGEPVCPKCSHPLRYHALNALGWTRVAGGCSGGGGACPCDGDNRAPSPTEKRDSTAGAAAVPEAGALRALQEIVTHPDPDRMRKIAYAALSSPSGDARPRERKPGFNEAMLPEGWAAREAAKRVAPSIPEEPKSPIVDPEAASQKEGIESEEEAHMVTIKRLFHAEAEVLRLTKKNAQLHTALNEELAAGARLTKERDRAREIHSDYISRREPEERDWAAAFTDSAAAMVLQAFGRIRQPDGSAPTYQSFNEYQSRALDALQKALLREELFSAEGRAVLARLDAAETSANALREAVVKAPHGFGCLSMTIIEGRPPAWRDAPPQVFRPRQPTDEQLCNCWKRAALAAPNPSAEKLTPGSRE